MGATPDESALSGDSVSLPGMAKVPGTSASYWGAGSVIIGNSTVSRPAVLAYGPTP